MSSTISQSHEQQPKVHFKFPEPPPITIVTSLDQQPQYQSSSATYYTSSTSTNSKNSNNSYSANKLLNATKNNNNGQVQNTKKYSRKTESGFTRRGLCIVLFIVFLIVVLMILVIITSMHHHNHHQNEDEDLIVNGVKINSRDSKKKQKGDDVNYNNIKNNNRQRRGKKQNNANNKNENRNSDKVDKINNRQGEVRDTQKQNDENKVIDSDAEKNKIQNEHQPQNEINFPKGKNDKKQDNELPPETLTAKTKNKKGRRNLIKPVDLRTAAEIDPRVSNITFLEALAQYEAYQLVDLATEKDDHKNFHFHINHPEHLQETKSYIDIFEFPGDGLVLPHRVGTTISKNGNVSDARDAETYEELILQPRVVFGDDHAVKNIASASSSSSSSTSGSQEENQEDTNINNTNNNTFSSPLEKQWRACDPTDTDFSDEKDQLCSSYLRNWNNILSVKALGSKLLDGRTIKFRLFYRHGNITAIIKVSQHKFVYEPISEMLAFGVERAIGFQKVPPTAWTPFPLRYLQAASGLVNPLYAQWFKQFVVDFKFLDPYRFLCNGNGKGGEEEENTILFQNVNKLSPYGESFPASSPSNEHDINSMKKQNGSDFCVNVTIQLWMEDVHPALNTYLALMYDPDEFFYNHFFMPRKGKPWPPKHEHRRQALGDMCDRFIFDFITGNTDRGMNDHNNFVYGGCDSTASACQPPEEEWKRTKGKVKYAFLDQGSAFYSHKEPEQNPFTGGNRTICRFKKATFEKLKSFGRSRADFKNHRRPLVDESLQRIPGWQGAFTLVHRSVFKTVQDRAEKIVKIVEGCVESFSEDEVLVL